MKEKEKYSLGFLFDSTMEHVLLIDKVYGPFPNKLNGIGGKVEDEDTNNYQAFIREFEEETDLLHGDIVVMVNLCTLSFPTIDVIVFAAIVKDPIIEVSTQNKEGELKWYNIVNDNILDSTNEKLAGYGEIPYFINYARSVLMPLGGFEYRAPTKSTKNLRWAL